MIVAISIIFTILATTIVVSSQGSPLSLELSATKNKITLGEMLNISVTLRNSSIIPLFAAQLDPVITENLKIYVSQDNKSYKRYYGQGWGHVCTDYEGRMRLLPFESITDDFSLFYNEKHDSSIDRNYIFTSPGIYYIKARLFNSVKEGETIESNPFQVIVEMPHNEQDAKTWEFIKNNPKVGRSLEEALNKGDKYQDPSYDEVVIKLDNFSESLNPDDMGPLTKQIKEMINSYMANARPFRK